MHLPCCPSLYLLIFFVIHPCHIIAWYELPWRGKLTLLVSFTLALSLSLGQINSLWCSIHQLSLYFYYSLFIFLLISQLPSLPSLSLRFVFLLTVHSSPTLACPLPITLSSPHSVRHPSSSPPLLSSVNFTSLHFSSLPLFVGSSISFRSLLPISSSYCQLQPHPHPASASLNILLFPSPSLLLLFPIRVICWSPHIGWTPNWCLQCGHIFVNF